MPKVNRYVDISTVDKEAKKDYIDRHSPFIHCAPAAKSGEKFSVTVRMGQEYAHPDDPDHYIRSIQLFNGETLLAETTFISGSLGGMGAKGNQEVTYSIVPSGSKLRLTAMAFCTKHGLWECDPVEVPVSAAE
ncbi:MAG: dethiobiotin synthase [Magnetococcales bacterium]|nr:class II SORL domain-containing protein [Magnetococcales bacterium]NGZ29047.1 dethiobiotin synthase [Magnetococcales bacterium]